MLQIFQERMRRVTQQQQQQQQQEQQMAGAAQRPPAMGPRLPGMSPVSQNPLDPYDHLVGGPNSHSHPGQPQHPGMPPQPQQQPQQQPPHPGMPHPPIRMPSPGHMGHVRPEMARALSHEGGHRIPFSGAGQMPHSAVYPTVPSSVQHSPQVGKVTIATVLNCLINTLIN